MTQTFQNVVEKNGTSPALESLKNPITTPTTEQHGHGHIRFSPKQHFVTEEEYKRLLNEVPAEEIVDYYPLSNAAEVVYKHFSMPFPLYPYQSAWVNALADKPAAGMYFEVGTGKSLTALAASLYHKLQGYETTIILMPPILLAQWEQTIKQVPEIKRVQIYAGTPAERSKISLDVDYLLMSIAVFKNDFQRIFDFFLNRRVSLIIDEATSIKNIATGNYKAVKAFLKGQSALFLNHKLKVKNRRADVTSVQEQKRDASESMNQLQQLLKDNYCGS